VNTDVPTFGVWRPGVLCLSGSGYRAALFHLGPSLASTSWVCRRSWKPALRPGRRHRAGGALRAPARLAAGRARRDAERALRLGGGSGRASRGGHPGLATTPNSQGAPRHAGRRGQVLDSQAQHRHSPRQICVSEERWVRGWRALRKPGEDAVWSRSAVARRMPGTSRSQRTKNDWRWRSVACPARSLHALKLVAPPSRRFPVGFRGHRLFQSHRDLSAPLRALPGGRRKRFRKLREMAVSGSRYTPVRHERWS
jgi:hypothetical protein